MPVVGQFGALAARGCTYQPVFGVPLVGHGGAGCVAGGELVERVAGQVGGGGAELLGQSVGGRIVGVPGGLCGGGGGGHGGGGELIRSVIAQAVHEWCLRIGLLRPGRDQPSGLVVAVDEFRDGGGTVQVRDLLKIVVQQVPAVTALCRLPVRAGLGCFAERVSVIGVGARAQRIGFTCHASRRVEGHG